MKGVIFLAIIATISAKPYLQPRADTCAGYNACPAIDDSKLNVHLIPHSHDDVGWLKTWDQYYYQNVQSVIGSVVLALQQDPARRFVQVETAYFKLWWRDQTDDVKQDVIELINEGRLEIINGAWSMNDEAAAHYHSTVDQFTLGLRYIEDSLGKCARPKIGWQIDPFGHSREQASLFTQLGFDGVFFARLDYRDKQKRKNDKTMEHLWTGSANLGPESNIFTHALYSHYSAPSDFCFDIRCGDAPIVMDEESPEYNWEARVNEFAQWVEGESKSYPTNNLLITMGDDFRWEAALTSYVNIDKLIKGFKKFNPKVNGKEVNVFYSTPSCYTKAINDYVKKNKVDLVVKTDDFFPYADSPHQVWTGYFTSRPTSKRFERQSNNLLQISKQLKAVADTAQDSTLKLEEAVGVMQHHDAITGTEKEAVKKDYHRLLSTGIDLAVQRDSEALSKILGLKEDLGLKSCLLSNVSICAESDKNEFNVVLFNPLAQSVSHYIQIPVSSGTWQVTDPAGKSLENYLTDPIGKFDYITDDAGFKVLEKVLFFKATLPALGYNVYNIKKTKSSDKSSFKKVEAVGKVGFTDNYVNFDDSTGLIKSVTIKNVTQDLTQQLMYYKSANNSGAYTFRPADDEDSRDAYKFSDKVTTEVLVNEGNLIREVRQTWNNWATQIVRIYKDEDFIEFDWLVGPIDISDDQGKDIINRFSSTIKSNGKFYTDSNGREMIYRKKNYRETYELSDEEPVSNNYYPVTASIVVRDDSQELSVLNDRAQGGSSLNDGEVELMVHRRLLSDDGKGVGEHLNETEYNRGLVARGSHYLTLSDPKSAALTRRKIAQRKLLAPWAFYTDKTINTTTQSFLKKELPQNIHLLTLDKWNDGQVLIRLEHILEKNENDDLSVDTTVDLTNLFTAFSITSLKEYALAANTPLDEVSRLTWPQVEAVESGPLSRETRLARADDDLKITLAPMQIRTFIATVSR